jgi:hypothetical protein
MDQERIRAAQIVVKMAMDYERTAEKRPKDDVAFVAGEIAAALREAASRIADGAFSTEHEALSRMKIFSEKRPTKHDLSKHIRH